MPAGAVANLPVPSRDHTGLHMFVRTAVRASAFALSKCASIWRLLWGSMAALRLRQLPQGDAGFASS